MSTITMHLIVDDTGKIIAAQAEPRIVGNGAVTVISPVKNNHKLYRLQAVPVEMLQRGPEHALRELAKHFDANKRQAIRIDLNRFLDASTRDMRRR